MTNADRKMFEAGVESIMNYLEVITEYLVLPAIPDMGKRQRAQAYTEMARTIFASSVDEALEDEEEYEPMDNPGEELNG